MINYYEGAKTKPEIFKQLFCKELLFVYYDCPLGSNRQDSWSQYNYILFIVTGEKRFYTLDNSWELKQGNAVFVKKGACFIEKVEGEVLCLMAFFIPDSYLVSFLLDNSTLIDNTKKLPLENELILPLEASEMMLRYYESVIPYFSSPIKPPEDLLELKFKELLFNIISNPANRSLNFFLRSLMSPQANNIQPVVEANYCYNLKIDDIAKLCNRSLSSFKRDFYNVYGESPAKWLLKKRLSLSLLKLKDHSRSIIDIAFECGFESSTHFSHAFKKQYGISPLQYRKGKLLK
jgi:AraC-like DNA-binding protein